MNGLDAGLLGIDLQKGEYTTQRAIPSVKGGTQSHEAKDQKSDIRKVAKEMEALFIYQLMKVMRETTDNISNEEKGLGNDTYTSLFDMEVSKVMAERGFGIRHSLEKFLERKINDTEKNKNIK